MSAPARNRPGLDQIAYRVGTHARFKQRMLAALSSIDRPGLEGLATRDDSDFAIALLDAWATVAHVLSFYSERIANESYLQTATERVSVRELARLVGYELRPGKAASVQLAFTLDTAEGSPPEVALPAGLKVNSVPASGQVPQTYETVEEITARGDWNALRPRMQRPQLLAGIDEFALVEGVVLAINPGDAVLLVRGNNFTRTVRTVVRATVDQATRTTRLDFAPQPTVPPAPQPPVLPVGRITLGRAPFNREWVTSNIFRRRWNQADLQAQLALGNVPLRALTRTVRATSQKPPPAVATVDDLPRQEGLYVFRATASIFGHNASEQAPGTKPGDLQGDVTLAAPDTSLFLDTQYPSMTRGSWIAVQAPGAQTETFQLREHTTLSRSKYGISAKVSRVTVRKSDAFPAAFKTRETTVLGATELLELAELPISEDIGGARIELDSVYLGLRAGQRVVVSGERTDLDGVVEHELRELGEVELVGGFTVLQFTAPLGRTYLRATVTVNANVAQATHGETVTRVLGSGDSAVPFQRFRFPDPSLTFLSSPSASGPRPALEIRVDGVAWREVDSLASAAPADQVFTLRHGENGATDVVFGDGVTGARLPTGAENVGAVYRKGNGLAGLVDAGALTLLVTKPAGLKAVTNPRASGAAADPDTVEDTRVTAPLVARTLDRVVSLQDYQDFTRAFPGIAKALATWAWSAQHRSVFLTVAGPDGTEIDESGIDVANLRAAIAQAGDPAVPLDIKSYTPVFFRIGATVRVDPAHEATRVFAEVEARLRAAFAFARRSFGRPVTRSEVITLIQSTPGVIAVDLNRFHRSEGAPTNEQRLVASLPRRVGDTMAAAELLLLDPRPPELGVQQ